MPNSAYAVTYLPRKKKYCPRSMYIGHNVPLGLYAMKAEGVCQLVLFFCRHWISFGH